MRYRYTGIAAIILLPSLTYALFGRGKPDQASEQTSASFVPANSVDHTAVDLALTAITTLGSTSMSGGSGNTLATSEQVINYNIVHALTTSNDARTLLDHHLTQLQISQNQVSQGALEYQRQISQAQSRLDICISNKQLSDAKVIEAINNNLESQINELLTTSIDHAQCIAQYSVTVKALGLVLTKYQKLEELITRKYTIITDNKSLLIQYPDVIADPSIIQQLGEISTQL